MPAVWPIPALLVLVLAACSTGGAPTPNPTPGTTILPGPTGGRILNPGELRLLVIERFGERWYCDPDEYPVSHGSEQERAIERFDEMVDEGVIYNTIAAKLGVNVGGAVTDAQKLAIYHVWKVALSIPFDSVGAGRYRFDYLAAPPDQGVQGLRTMGIVNADGSMVIEQQAAAGEPVCPICLARGTLIHTQAGRIAVQDLRLGDPIWTLDATGRRVAGIVIALGSTAAPANHHVIRLTLADGRSVTASPGHPLANGRTLGTLALGDLVDGSRVAGLESMPYSGGETFDLVASGATGIYFSDGIPLRSTLVPSGS
ncbi:MAG: Hint domain-containing protein [Candidatus Limnocylindrales bacterium]